MAPDGLLMQRALDLAQAARQDRGGSGPFRLSGGDLRRALRRPSNAANTDSRDEEAAVVGPATGAARGSVDAPPRRPSTSRMNSSELAGAWRSSIRPPGLPSSPRSNPTPHRRRPRSASPPPSSPRPPLALLPLQVSTPSPSGPLFRAFLTSSTPPPESTFSPANPLPQHSAAPSRIPHETERLPRPASSGRADRGASFRDRMESISVAGRTSETDAILRGARNALRVAVSFAER